MLKLNSKQKDVNLYICIFLFVLILLFLKEHLFYGLQMSGIISGFISFIVCVGLFNLLKRFSLTLKIVTVIFVLSFIFIYSQINKAKTETLLQKQWMLEEDELTLKVKIQEDDLIMSLLPENETDSYRYNYVSNSLKLYDENGDLKYLWEIKKLTQDSLIVFENKKDLLQFKAVN